ATSPQLFTFSLPFGNAGAGTFLVTVTADNSDATSGNHSATTTFDSTLAPTPDLIVKNASLAATTVGAPLQSGSAGTVSRADSSQGSGDTSANGSAGGSFSDYVQVQQVDSTGNVLATVDARTLFYNAATSGELGVGQSVQQSYSLVLPDGAVGAGTFQVVIA